MPFLRIQTNVAIAAETVGTVLAAASKTVAAGLGKPDRYVMVTVEPERPMIFAGSTAPTAILELSGIGLPAGQAPALSQALCTLLEAEVGIARDRVFVIFTAVDSTMWGWNGHTF